MTFSYSSDGPTGLLPHMKVALLNARGGVYQDDPSEMAVRFVRNQLAFFGIQDLTTVVIEGHHQFPDRRAALIDEGLTG
ncbi:NAD(P)H-dependent oxidoreductase [Xylanibacillus composti]|uniref:Flavodoxin-like fold domain-containing protein n=1 Tax=Xylanibacillus composti TaxID=1572762 RepID=A0A8J4GZJ0_9BACL|nr:NAD(P)H-dependent oxidoreductase [Xylanibacillus composti]GIQ68117.1 hypothetical protein XYCOK13_09410 [Xylanibacillus composti]